MATGRIPINGTAAIQQTLIDAKGDLIAGTGADAVARLAVGANGTTLVADSAEATGLKWATASSGGMTLISEQVASANSSLSFSSIAGTYKQLLLVWDGINHSTTGSIFSLRINANTGSVYNGYTLSTATTSGNAIGSFNNAGSYVVEGANLGLFGRSTDIASPASYHNRGWFLLDNYASSTRTKPYKTQFEYGDNTAATQVVGATSNGSFTDTTAVTSLDIVRISGAATITNAANTSIRLYGVS